MVDRSECVRGRPPMPFVEICRMDERVRMLTEWDSGNWSVAELCRRYGVCRDTLYAWQARRGHGDAAWFVERSHAPRHCPHRTGPAVAAAIVALRRRFPHLGPRKLLAMLERDARATRWPAAATIGDLRKRAGLGSPARRRRRALDPRRPVAAGWWPTTHGRPTSGAGCARKTSAGSIR